MIYTKQAITLTDQINILKQRGLTIDDENEALDVLGHVSYFRLAGYWRPLEQDKQRHIFKPNSHFSTVVSLYRFDTELRMLIFSAIQRIEIAVRTKMIQHVALKHGPFWFMDTALASNNSIHVFCLNNLKQELSRSSDEFIKEHFRKYSSPSFPPVWKTLEVASMGTLSKLYNNLNDFKVRKRIAHDFNLPEHQCMGSWLRSLTVVRNACAHHARLWNAHISITPQTSVKMRGTWINDLQFPQDKLYPQLCCIAYWLNSIDANNHFTSDVKALLAKYPMADVRAMGFTANWKAEPLWK